jgi:cell division protein YceG involved in septum cleavage|tara:strand:+ start:118 stop:528 length:411 start_codon:yes stop_codon:yes gene_type:complete
MKTNKQEREAIAKKFYKRLQDKMVLRNEKFKKMSTYKELKKLEKAKNDLNKEVVKVNDTINKTIASYNKLNPSDYWKLSHDRDYDYNTGESNYDYRLALDSEWCVIPELSNAILIAQVGAETVEQLFEILEKEVSV